MSGEDSQNDKLPSVLVFLRRTSATSLTKQHEEIAPAMATASAFGFGMKGEDQRTWM